MKIKENLTKASASIQGEVQLSQVEEAVTTWWDDVSLVMWLNSMLDEMEIPFVE